MTRGPFVCAAIVLGAAVRPAPAASAADLALRGFVRDAATRTPVAGATASVSGAESRSEQLTDDAGFFRLSLPAIGPGGLVRLRVQKAGYVVFDRNVGVSEEVPVDVALVPLKSDKHAKAARGEHQSRSRPHPDVPDAATDPAPTEEDLLLAQMKSPDSRARSAAVEAFRDRNANTAAAKDALLQALADPDDQVRRVGLEAFRRLKPDSRAVLARVIHLLHDPQAHIVNAAAAALGELGAAARPAIPELLVALQRDWSHNLEVRTTLVETLMLLGESRDRRLVAALADGVADRTLARARPVLVGAFQAHPDLVGTLASALLGRLQALGQDLSAQDHLVATLASWGEPGRQALATFGSQLRGPRQGEFALLWFNVKGAVRSDVLAVFPARQLASMAAPFLNEDLPTNTNFRELPLSCGMAAVAAGTLLALDAEPRDKVLLVFRKLLAMKSGLGFFGPTQCALESLREAPPEGGRKVLALAIDVLAACPPVFEIGEPFLCNGPSLQDLEARLAALGDTSTLALLTRLGAHRDPEIRRVATRAAAAIRAGLARRPPDQAAKP